MEPLNDSREPHRYRKRPVVIEAVRFDGHNDVNIIRWAGLHDVTIVSRHDGDPGKVWHLLISTLEGVMRADMGDWIICGVQGEFYPCKPDIFEQTYEAANDE